MSDDHRSSVRRNDLPPSVSRPVVAPIHPSVVYRTTDADELDRVYEGGAHGYTYAREGHPNASALAKKLDWMEGATGGTVTGSGMAAISAMFLALLSRGDHIVAGDQLYGRSLRLLTQELPRLGFYATLVDPTNASAVADAIRPETRLILVETISNPTLRVADLDGIAAVIKDRDILLAVDNTFTTPANFRPFDHGASVVIHSVTKLLSGHSDATLGYIVADTPDRNKAIYDSIVSWGMTPSPFDCWLAERGLNTFDLRVERAQANARALADFLADQPGVERVLYPGRPDHPDHNRAVALLDGGHGAMVCFHLTGGRAAVNAFLRATEHIPFAPTLGDVATTIAHPPSSSHRALSPDDRAAIGIPEGFIRVSVGIEDLEMLKREFRLGLAAASRAG